MEFKPNFSEYSYDELLDAKRDIDQELYPQRYAEVIKLLTSEPYTSQKNAAGMQNVNDNKYSTFWPRFFAAIIDGIVFAIVLYVECLIFSVEYSAQDRLLQALNGVQLALYVIFMHGYYGQTLGKMIMELKVLNCEDEAPIHFKQSLLRESVNLGLNVLWVFIILVLTLSIQLYGTISLGLSSAVLVFGILGGAWALSEFVTMLFNDKRRAVHDFIGKTVVVRINTEYVEHNSEIANS